MDDNVVPIDPELRKSAALICIALERKFGTTDQLLILAGEQDGLFEEKIKELEGQISQIKEQIKKIEAMLQAIDQIMPKLASGLASDSEDGVCSDSDPRKVELLRLCDDPLIVVEEWQRLSQSYSRKEKTAFVERMLLIIEELDLFELGLSNLYPRPTL